MSGDQYDEGYFLHGKQTGKSLYENYRWLPSLTIPMACSMIRHLSIDANDIILDFGCARGYTVKAFRELGYNAWGYDISQWALDNADEGVKNYLICNNSTLFANSFDWIIAKDVLEHIEDIGEAISLLKKVAHRGIFVIVPLAHGKEYDVPEYEKDVTHIHRQSLQWWVGQFHQPGWSIEARYQVRGIKDNYAQYRTGNGFIVARRVSC